MNSTMPPELSAAPRTGHSTYWQKVRRLTLLLLLLWFLVNVGVIFFARELASLTIGGWPVSFYMAAQGATLIYLLIIGGYAYAVNRIEQQEKQDECDEIE